ncbi:MAG: hypothetical protein KAS15_06065 [Nanoarchaeota archaeon]|nr:hypothetical protein [Nanoarchaeota archaeon]
MKCPDAEYINNLEYFLQHSDEDKIDSQYFLKRFSEIYGGCPNSLRWLDVGAGPGTKPIQILKGYHGYKGLLERFSRVELSVIEPSSRWQQILSGNFRRKELERIVYGKYEITWEEFVSQNSYDLITFFHSVYGIKIESLGKIPDFLQEKGIACVVVESPNSDLHLIKKSIFPYIHHKELVSSSDTIISLLKQEGINYLVDEQETEQRFYVDEILDLGNPGRIVPLSFILQTKPEDHNELVPQEVQKKIDNELRKYVKVDGEKSYINVPDRFIWIYK